MALVAGPAAGRDLEIEDVVAFRLERQASGALAVLGISAVPNETASTLFLSTGSDSDSTNFQAGQLGGGFTLSEGFPLYLEGYIGYNRYSPRFLLTDGTETAPLNLKWTGFAATGGIGWDFSLAEHLKIRPMVNVSLGQILSDTAFVADFIADAIGAEDANFLRDGGLTAGGYGGSLVMVYNQRWASDLEADATLRYTYLHLQPIAGDKDVTGSADAETLALWTRLRMPTGRYAFGSPVRSVAELSASWLPGDQGEVLNTDWLAQVGYGLELDVSKTWIPLVRQGRVMFRYTRGEYLEGYGLGLAVNF
jgi:Autotransporter beta-domain